MPKKDTNTSVDNEDISPSESVSDLIKRIPEVAQARDYGVDIPMLLDNLNRPVIERIKRHQIALETFEKLRKAKKQ
jgi:hypothetical protein